MKPMHDVCLDGQDIAINDSNGSSSSASGAASGAEGISIDNNPSDMEVKITDGDGKNSGAKLPWAEGFTVLTSSIRFDADDLVETSEEREISRCSCQQKHPKEPTCYNGKCFNFACMTECSKCYSTCQNKRIQQCKTWPVEVREAPNKGHGIFTPSDVPAGTYLFEYIGEIIGIEELESRRLSTLRDEHMYVMEIKKNAFIDSTKKGNISRFINHSCDPNCTAEVWNVKGRYRVGIFTTKAVPAGGELTFDYQWEPLANRPLTKCFCGSENCRGTIEVPSASASTGSNKGINGSYGYAAVVRKGQWRSSTDAFAEAAMTAATAESSGASEVGVPNGDPESSTSAATTRVALNPQWLVNKRVKIWWEGNQAYFEGDVTGYIEKTNQHTIHYSIDGSNEAELLWVQANTDIDGIGSSSNSDPAMLDNVISWMWLDETREDPKIRRRERSSGFLPIVPQELIDDPSASGQIPNAPTESGVPTYTPLLPSMYKRRVAFEFSIVAAAYLQEQLLGKCSIQTVTKSDLHSYFSVSDGKLFDKVRDSVTYIDPRTMRGSYRYLETLQACLRAVFKDTNIWVSDSLSPVYDASLWSHSAKLGHEKGTSLSEGILVLTEFGLFRPGTRFDRMLGSGNAPGAGVTGDSGFIGVSSSASSGNSSSGNSSSGNASGNSGGVSEGEGQWVVKTYQLNVLGTEEIVTQIEQLMATAQTSFMNAYMEWRLITCKARIRMQSTCIRVDWRALFMPISSSYALNIQSDPQPFMDCSCVPYSLNKDSSNIDAATLYDSLHLDGSVSPCTDAFYTHWMANNASLCAKLFGPRGLQIIRDNASLNLVLGPGSCSEAVYCKQIAAIRSICKRLHYSTSISLRAVVILLRVLRVYNETYVSLNAPGLLGASIVLALKSLFVFRPKSLLKIALSIYCEQLNRDEKHELLRFCGMEGSGSAVSADLATPSSGSVGSLHIQKLVVEERKLVHKFGFDVAGIDALPLTLSASPYAESIDYNPVSYDNQIAVLTGTIPISNLTNLNPNSGSSPSEFVALRVQLLESFLLFLASHCCLPSSFASVGWLRPTMYHNGIDIPGCSPRLDALSIEHWAAGAALVMHMLWDTSSTRVSYGSMSSSNGSSSSYSNSTSSVEDMYCKAFSVFPFRNSSSHMDALSSGVVDVVNRLLQVLKLPRHVSMHAVATVCASLLSLSQRLQACTRDGPPMNASHDVSFAFGNNSPLPMCMSWIYNMQRFAEIPVTFGAILASLPGASYNESGSVPLRTARCPLLLVPILTAGIGSYGDSVMTNSSSSSSGGGNSGSSSNAIGQRGPGSNKTQRADSKSMVGTNSTQFVSSMGAGSQSKDEFNVVYNEDVYWLSNHYVSQYIDTTLPSSESLAYINRFSLKAETVPLSDAMHSELPLRALYFVADNCHCTDSTESARGQGRLHKNATSYVAILESTLLAINSIHAFDVKVCNVSVNRQSYAIDDELNARPPEALVSAKLRLASVRRWVNASVDAIDRKKLEAHPWLNTYYNTCIPAAALSELVLFERLHALWRGNEICPFAIAPAAIGCFVAPPVDTTADVNKTTTSRGAGDSTSVAAVSKNDPLSPSKKRVLETPMTQHAPLASNFNTPMSTESTSCELEAPLSTIHNGSATTPSPSSVTISINALITPSEGPPTDGSVKKRRRQFAFPAAGASPQDTPPIIGRAASNESAPASIESSPLFHSVISSASPISPHLHGNTSTPASGAFGNAANSFNRSNTSYNIKFRLFGHDSTGAAEVEMTSNGASTPSTGSSRIASNKADLYLLFPPVYMPLAECLSIAKRNNYLASSPGFMSMLIRDVFAAVDYCVNSCGVVFRYLSIEHFTISSNAKILIQDLSGACSLEADPTLSVTNSSKKSSGSLSTSSRGSGANSISSRNALNSSSSGSGSSSSSGSSKLVIANKTSYALSFTLPSTMVHCTAPEVLLGAPASPASSMWCAALVGLCIALGAPVVRPSGHSNQAASESLVNAHFQNLFRCLGTPKAVGFTNFESLPLGACIKPTVTAPNGTETECRFRLAKHLCEVAPKGVICAYKQLGANTAPTHVSGSVDSKKAALLDEWRSVGLLADLVHGAHMTPRMRPAIASVLSASPLFTSPLPVATVDSDSTESMVVPVLDGDRIALFKRLIASRI